MKIYDPASYLKACGHILFEMLSSNLRPDWIDLRYLRYIDSEVEKTANDFFCCVNHERAL